MCARAYRIKRVFGWIDGCGGKERGERDFGMRMGRRRPPTKQRSNCCRESWLSFCVYACARFSFLFSFWCGFIEKLIEIGFVLFSSLPAGCDGEAKSSWSRCFFVLCTNHTPPSSISRALGCQMLLLWLLGCRSVTRICFSPLQFSRAFGRFALSRFRSTNTRAL